MKNLIDNAAKELVKQHNRNYAKRQLTWWRGQTQALWIHPSDPNKALLAIREISR